MRKPAPPATSVASFRALEARGLRPDWVAGHSLGEYSALVAAGALTLGEAVVAVRRRGEYMQEAVPVGTGAMAAILGLDLATVEECCRKAAGQEVVAPANINGPGQVVIAGHTAAVDRAAQACMAAGAMRAIRLSVSAPFHCALMMPAQERMARELAALPFRDPVFPLVNNVDARPVRSAGECRDGLVRQVSGAVRWQESVEVLVGEGVGTFVEVGPGTVLSGLVRKIARDARFEITWHAIELATSPEPAFAVLIPSNTASSDNGPYDASARQSWFTCVSSSFIRSMCES